MSMQIRQKDVIISADGEKITVAEAGWDYSFKFTELEKELLPKLQDSDQSETFKFFLNNYYSLMASCVVGDVPSAEEAFRMPRTYLDNWYLAVWELNEDIIGKPYVKTLESEEVTFRDGNTIHIFKAEGLPSFIIKLVELEEYANKHPIEDDPQGQLFQLMFYPKMAAACNGSTIPSAEEARSWPRAELNKWMSASRRMNSEWYVTAQPEIEETNKKKERKGKKKLDG